MANERRSRVETGDANDEPIVVWLRNDLRLDDNPALAHAAETGRPVVPLVVLDDDSEGVRRLGGAHRWWFHHSLSRFGEALRRTGSELTLRRGRSEDAVRDVIRETGASALFFNERYDQASRGVDAAICEALAGEVETDRFPANLLHDPDAVRTTTGSWYKVYTPFWRKISAAGPRDPIDPPERLARPETFPRSDMIEDWGLPPTSPDWSTGFSAMWEPGEAAAFERFAQFCETQLPDYHHGRDRPSEDATSRLSPHLRWGEISPCRLWHDVQAFAAEHDVPEEATKVFLKELAWRDFNYHLLYHFGPLARSNFNPRFDRFAWRNSASDLKAWQRGTTGYPIVDAGMRQLWQTGWMHNRVRLIVGSFLTKDLLIDWREGESWFWDTLVDGDIASNTSQWQWIAGTGADAQPYFRIFNPVTQSERFDRHGDYIRSFVPELEKLPDRHVHAPWKADADVLAAAGVVLGKTYPNPVVDHGAARDRALVAFSEIRG